jgi:hypothetical protein
MIDGKPYDKSQELKNIDFKEASKSFGINEEELKENCFIY